MRSISAAPYETLTSINYCDIHFMYIIPLAWFYVVVMMTVAEASSSNGTLLGALITFVLYGVVPIGLILYFMGAPARKRAIRAREVAEHQASLQPDHGSLAAAEPVAPVGKEP